MVQQDTAKLKEKILSTIKFRGPSLPVHIAKETGLSILFAGAFLSELAADKDIKISHMKVGGSPLYFNPEQEHKLENFSQHLKSKEKDAFLLLKEKKFLKDKDQEPAIRVALRYLKDFAVPFEKESEVYWRYFKIPEIEFKPEQIIEQPKKEIPEIPEKIAITSPIQIKPNSLDIFDKEEQEEIKEEKLQKEKPTKKQIKRKVAPSKTNDKFFNKVKENLNSKNIEIAGIEGFSKNELFLKIKKNKKEYLITAFNKKRISESDILKSHKKSQEISLPYIIMSLGEPAKKTQNLIDAIKDLDSLEKIE
ncbi:MAG: hypothetical protein KKF48_01415 [Nanoarchaeota archaeon]|nr:hypothetical protein [Nanoarchaeota archaeon]MBU1027681.1 hypothetical protein [Nanoarchaeota archaeon]